MEAIKCNSKISILDVTADTKNEKVYVYHIMTCGSFYKSLKITYEEVHV